MEVKLRVVGGKNAGQEVLVRGPKFFIGRADDCQLRPRSEMISRHHCVILVEEGYVAVRDFGSKNGTLVNGERVASEQELKTGDRLAVGMLEFEVLLSQSVAETKKPEGKTVEQAAQQTVSVSADDSVGDDELNLDDWFGSGEEAEDDYADTKTVDMSDLVSSRDFSRKKAAEGQADGGDQPKVVGVSAARAKNITAATSRGAAEDALKKLLRGGK